MAILSLGTVRAGASTSCTDTLVTFKLGKRGALGFLEEGVDVVLGAAVFAALAGKGGNTGAGIDNDGLTLRRSADPKVHVVSAVALVQPADFESRVVMVLVVLLVAFLGLGGREIAAVAAKNLMVRHDWEL